MGNPYRKATPEDRLRVVRLIDEQNRDPQLVADVFGVSRSSVYEWLRKYREGGPEALYAQAALGRPTAISEQQVKHLYSLIRNHEPREFGFGTALWTRAIIGLLIHREFDMRLSQPTVVKILTRLGLHTARGSLPKLTGTSTESLIRAKARQACATVLSGGITRVDRGVQFGGGEQDHMVSAVDGRGQARFSVSPTWPDAGRLIAFGAGLLRDAPTPTFLVVRCRSVCTIAEVRQFVDDTGGRLGLFVLRAKNDGEDVVEYWGR